MVPMQSGRKPGEMNITFFIDLERLPYCVIYEAIRHIGFRTKNGATLEQIRMFLSLETGDYLSIGKELGMELKASQKWHDEFRSFFKPPSTDTDVWSEWRNWSEAHRTPHTKRIQSQKLLRVIEKLCELREVYKIKVLEPVRTNTRYAYGCTVDRVSIHMLDHLKMYPINRIIPISCFPRKKKNQEVNNRFVDIGIVFGTSDKIILNQNEMSSFKDVIDIIDKHIAKAQKGVSSSDAFVLLDLSAFSNRSHITPHNMNL
jgi:hypothetical protein